MATRTTVHDVIEDFRTAPTNSERGEKFERLMVDYFWLDPTLSVEYDEVQRWPDWRHREGTHDTGIDLVAARNMFFLELPLTAVDFEQLKGRINRLSQTSNALSYWYMTIRGSLEENLGWERIRRKQ